MGYQLLQCFNGRHTKIDSTLHNISDNYYEVYIRHQPRRCCIISADLAAHQFSFSMKRFFYFQSFHLYLLLRWRFLKSESVMDKTNSLALYTLWEFFSFDFQLFSVHTTGDKLVNVQILALPFTFSSFFVRPWKRFIISSYCSMWSLTASLKQWVLQRARR